MHAQRSELKRHNLLKGAAGLLTRRISVGQETHGSNP
jgi:hypothetical protein